MDAAEEIERAMAHPRFQEIEDKIILETAGFMTFTEARMLAVWRLINERNTPGPFDWMPPDE